MEFDSFCECFMYVNWFMNIYVDEKVYCKGVLQNPINNKEIEIQLIDENNI